MNTVKQIRESQGIQQEEMAKKLEMSPGNYSKKENGKLKWSLAEAREISTIFGKTIEEIFFANEVSK